MHNCNFIIHMIHIKSMLNISNELQVLARATNYPNLSSAAQNIGISQPQLSRIIKKIEDIMGLTLLDRTAKRKSGWMPIAKQIADTYQQNERKLQFDLESLRSGQNLTHLRVGALEGLIPLANNFCHKLFDQLGLTLVELDVFDVMELEELFEAQSFDIIFSFRELGKRKYKYSKILGYQEMQRAGKGPVKVVSPFEYERSFRSKKKQQDSQFLISNSLIVRKQWLDTQTGVGMIPTEIKPPKQSYGKNELLVLLIGTDVMPPAHWDKISTIPFA